MKDAYVKACIDLDKQAYLAMDIIVLASVINLSRNYGWKKLRIKRFMEVSMDVFADCGSDNAISMISLCDQETGIEIRSDKNESYLDCPYLCEETWENMKDDFLKKPDNYKKAWLTRMKQKMKWWMIPQVTAAVLLSLHRKEGWGFGRMCRFMDGLNDIRIEYADDPKKLLIVACEETGMEFVHSESGELLIMAKDDE